jgi:hypothetical protein
MTTEVKSKKNIYEDAILTQDYVHQAVNLGEKVLALLSSQKVASEYEDTLNKINEAASQGDVTTVLELSKKLGDIQHNRATHEKSFIDLKKKYTFSDVLQAFNKEFEELAYTVAHETLVESHKAVAEATKAKGTRGPNKPVDSQEGKETRPAAVYKISKDGKSIEFILRAGPAKLDQDKEAFEFLGFKLVDSADGKKKVLEPAELVFDNGDKVKAARSSIVKALNDGGIKMFADYDIAEIKPTA